MFTWAHIGRDGDLVIDWDEVRMNSDMFDRGHRNRDAEMGKLIAVISRESWERGFAEGAQADGVKQLLYMTGGNS